MRGSHLESWIGDGRAILIPATLSAAFAEHIERLPWRVSSLDWSKLPSARRISLPEASERQLLDWFESTQLARHSHLVMWFSPKEDGLAVEAREALKNLDVLFWDAPGTRFAYSAELKDGLWVPAFGDFLEYTGGDTITASS